MNVGRPPRYWDALSAPPISVRLNQTDAEYLIAWCARERIPLSALLRETALKAACAVGLGIGLESATYAGEYGMEAVDGPVVLPVKVSSQQRACIRAHARRIGAKSVSGFMKKCAIEHVDGNLTRSTKR